MPVKIWVGRFAIVDGQPQEESAFLRSFPRQRPDEAEDELYVLVEPATPASKEYCGQLADAVGRMYRQDPLSITGAMLRALQSAHRQLHDWNTRTLREHRVGAGVGCLAVRERVAYLTQIGPSVAYHVGGGRVERIVAQDGSSEPIGEPEQIEPVVERYELVPGDLLLLASPKIEELIAEGELRAVLQRGAEESLVELFRMARGEQEFSLILLACVVDTEPEPAPVAPARPAEAPAGAEEPAAAPAETVEEAPEAAVEAAPAVPDVGPSPVTEEAPEEEEKAPAEPAVPVAAGTDPDALREALAPISEPPAGLTQPKVRLKGADAEVTYRRSTGIASGLPRIPPIVIIAAVLIVAAGLLAWLVIPSALEESRSDSFTTSIEDARDALRRAEESDNPAQQREALREADMALQEAELLRSGDATVADVRQQVDAALNELNAVTELPELQLIVDVSSRIPGAVSSKDLALGGGGAYFLDREQHRVIAVSLLGPNPDPFVLFASGDLVGGEVTGEPQHIAWAEDLGALLVLDGERRLIAITPPGSPTRILTVRDAGAWDSADGIAHRDGALYVLDRGGSQVWRYPPSESGFDSEREPLLPSLDVDQVVEMDVTDALYLILADESILRVLGRDVQPFSQAGIDEALSAPGSLAPAGGNIYIADRGNDRIAVFSADGAFLQQLKSSSFTDLRAIAIDEPNGLLYALVGSTLYRTPVPPLP